MRKSLTLFLAGIAIMAVFGLGFYVHASQTVDEATWASVQTSIPLTGTSPSLGGGVLSAGACSSATTTITGATTAMSVAATPATTTNIGALAIWKGYVSAANEVTVNVCAIILGTPVATPYNIRVIR